MVRNASHARKKATPGPTNGIERVVPRAIFPLMVLRRLLVHSVFQGKEVHTQES